MTGCVDQQLVQPTLDESPSVDQSPSDRPKRVLMLTHRLPYPPDRGDRIRSYHTLKLLAEHFDVSIACTSDEPVWLQHHQLLSTIAKRVAIQPISTKMSKIKVAHALATGKSFTPEFYYRQGLADTILQWDEQAPFDAILTFCTGMIRYARLLIPPINGSPPKNGKPTVGEGAASSESRHRPVHVMDLVDVDSIKWRSYAQHSWPPMSWVYGAEAKRLQRIEAGRYDDFDALAVVSEAEAQAYRDHVGDHPGLIAVGNGVDLDYFSPLPDTDSRTLAFVGVLNYAPNAEGITWFVHHVFWRLRKRVPDAKLLIVGRHPTPRIEALEEQAGVEVVGSVPDVRVYMQEASAIIAPLRIARGVQNKVLEAMACARAVVCSTAAAEGIDAQDGQHYLVAQDPEHWVDQLECVLTDSSQRQRLAAAARQHVEQTYCWEHRLSPLITALQDHIPR